MVSVRHAAGTDAQVIAEISVACWRWAYAHIIRPEHMAALEAVRRTDRTREKLRQGEVIYVAATEIAVVGFAVIQEPCTWCGADYEVSGLYVHPGAEVMERVGDRLTQLRAIAGTKGPEKQIAALEGHRRQKGGGRIHMSNPNDAPMAMAMQANLWGCKQAVPFKARARAYQMLASRPHSG